MSRGQSFKSASLTRFTDVQLLLLVSFQGAWCQRAVRQMCYSYGDNRRLTSPVLWEFLDLQARSDESLSYFTDGCCLAV